MRPSQTQCQTVKQQKLSIRGSRPRLIRGATAGMIAAAILGTTGCKSMPFELPKMEMPKLAMPSMPKLPKPKLAKPDMSKLAFWKSENLMGKKGKLPKPPSLSFDPSPIKQALASSKESAKQEIETLKGQIAEKKEKLTAPLREPYTFEAESSVDKLADSGDVNSDFETSRNSEPARDLVDAKITKAQRDFQAALARSSKALEKSLGNQVADLKSSTNDFQVPAAVKSAKTNVDDSLMAVNRSLYDAQGKLASTAETVSEKVDGAAKPGLSLFEKRLAQATEESKTTVAEVATSLAASSDNAFGGVAAPTKPAKPSPVAATPAPKVQVSSEVAELKTQLALLRAEQQKLIEQQKKQLEAYQHQIATKPEAKEYVASMNAAPAPTAPMYQPSTTSAQPAINYPTISPQNVPVRTASNTNNMLYSTPQNVLRGNFSPVSDQGSSYQGSQGGSQYQPAESNSNQGSGYPSTPHNGYGSSSNYSANIAPTHTGSTKAAQVSFQENGDSNLVITASTPVEPAERHVSEVNIPEAVLRGTSNYAPGTVHSLR